MISRYDKNWASIQKAFGNKKTTKLKQHQKFLNFTLHKFKAFP